MCTFDSALRWVALSPPAESAAPPPLRSPVLVAVNQDIYLFGGRTDDLRASNDLWWFSGGSWHKLATERAPPGRFDCSLNVFQEKLILFGGQDTKTIFNDLWQFNIPTLEWRQLDIPNPLSPRFAHATAFTTTQLWLFGGKKEVAYFNDFYCCDLYEERWFRIETRTIPEARAWHSAFWVNTRNAVFFTIYGGAGRSSAQSSIWMFDYDAGDWFAPQIAGDHPGPRFAHVTAVLDDRLYIIGGRNMTNTVVDPICVDISRTPFNGTIIPQMDEPDPFQFGACAVWDNVRFALYGGPPESGHRGLWEIRLRDPSHR
jgi:N-acetylneuraminic acid mutarotase